MKKLLVLLFCLLPCVGWAQDDDKLAELKGIRKERRALTNKYNKLESEAESESDVAAIQADREAEELKLVEKTIRLCRELDEDIQEIKILTYLTRFADGQARDLAAKALAIDYMESKHLGTWVESIARVKTPFPHLEKWLRAIKDSSPHQSVKGKATFALMQHMKKLADASNAARKEMASAIGEDGENYLASRDRKKCDQAVEWLAKVCTEEFPTAKLGNVKAGDIAKAILKAKRFEVGKIAPDIVGVDLDGIEFKLSDYRGKVVVLDFWGDW